ncbi:glycoside hydrolase family 43 protein [Gracilibacillus caseinilyticus]|uniref:Glycoside hydrolase family 43 protein n=1 Tax=Gracilibacillus caseinilyticus TaxID=2932256 RepID=A0ABY4EQD5_9BACI|nr:glycoside hydrolase family 43 protein [Gracilibacillus caseinilyticus]UOQ46658.1 glycoside hydrolase family 43 protein [Gracilibacillus caseinilyticus]
MLKNQDIQIRDPFIYVNREEGKYYLYGSTDKDIWGKGTGFDVYIGTDLEHWDGPFPVFRPDASFYSDENFWAPEVHYYNGDYYLFATFLLKESGMRGTAILKSSTLTGPFQPHSEGIVTPNNWHSLDGTLHIDREGAPWMVFCHEWIQVGDGEICAIRLKADLSDAVGEPITLFAASEAQWPTSFTHKRFPSQINYVTDGPYLYDAENGELLMLWASFVDSIYAQGISRSVSGQLTGPWQHDDHPLFTSDGGHGMLFHDKYGRLQLTLHSPNRTPEERPIFIELEESSGKLRRREDG